MAKGNLGAALAQRANGQNGNGGQPAPLAGIKSLLNSPAIKQRFEEVLGKRSAQFAASIVNLVSADKYLQLCEPMSVISSCMVAATLDLPVDKNLGYMWVVPYKNKQGIHIAQPQMGYKGYIQLALRTAYYKSINAIPVYEGELVKWNPLTEELEIDFEQRKSDAVIGYAGYFELLNGFKKTVYWPKERIIAHAKKYSKSFHKEDSPWQDPDKFEGMALKTVIRNMLSKWGILSIEMRDAFSQDLDTKLEYGEEPDVDDANVIDVTAEVTDAEEPQENIEPQQSHEFDGQEELKLA
jgi:recombination protein RecT